jgi:hypothetical protein
MQQFIPFHTQTKKDDEKNVMVMDYLSITQTLPTVNGVD